MKILKEEKKADKNKPMEEVVKDIEKEYKDKTGIDIKLMAETADDTVNGHVNSVIKGNDRIVTVTYYKDDEDPTYDEYKYNGANFFKGRKTTIKKAS